MASPSESLIGTTVDGRYEIVGPLGEGAMGVVYRARHLTLQRHAALKVLHDKHGKNPVLVERFLREARAASQVSHPNVVPIYDFGQLDSGQPYMAMELREVPTLADRIEAEGPFDVGRALGITASIADALASVHGAGIIHRDLKPENIAVGDRDHVTVLDFGIAKVAGGGRLTSTGEVVGTPLYMSPEQCRGDPIDPRTDVYALGAILFEMLTREPPFDGPSIVAIVSAHLMNPPPDPRERAPSVPGPVASLVTACLEKDRERRPASMAALRERCATVLAAGDAHTLYAAAPATGGAEVTSSEPAAPAGPNALGISSAVFGGAALVLTLVGVGLGVSVQDDVARLERVCNANGLCPPSQSDLVRDAWVRAQASNITGTLGLLLGAAAVVQLIVALREELAGGAPPAELRVDAAGVGVAF